MSARIYGISNCDTVRKARKWLNNAGVTYEFLDFNQTPPDQAQLTDWEARCGWESLLNRKSATWRSLADEDKANIDRDSAL